MREEILRLIEKNSRIDIHEMAILLGAKYREQKRPAIFPFFVLAKGLSLKTIAFSVNLSQNISFLSFLYM